MIPHITNTSLLSIGQLCNDDCIALFHKKFLHIYKNNKLILRGNRNQLDGLWDIPFRQCPQMFAQTKRQVLNVILQKNKTKFQLANFYHGDMCSPVLTTLQKAIRNNHLVSWPAIHKINFPLNIIDTRAIDMGHLDQERTNLQSTRNYAQSKQQASPVISEPSMVKSFEVLNTIIPFTAKEMSYGDLTGTFPYTSSRGSKYLYIMYDYDANAILVAPLKTRQGHEIKTVWEKLIARLTKHGHVTKHFVMDNECSWDLRKAIKNNNMDFQLVPPHNHRVNAAERAIRTFKSHFLSTLATCDPDYPITEWDRLLQQSEMTLNLLRVARCNPKLSAYAYLEGQHDYNRTPLAPPGTRVIIH